MAFAIKYKFVFNSVHGATTEIRILKDGYSGEVIQRSLGRAPILKKKQNGPVSGTSLELWAECLVNGEFAELYTSDPKEFRVDLLRNNTTIWTGFVSTELYSEPGIAPPYDVQIIATDGLGELKLNNYEAQGELTIGNLFVYLLSLTGSDRQIQFAWKVKPNGSTIPALINDVYVNLDYMAGKTMYEVLTYVLNSFHAVITPLGTAWLVYRETDFTSSQTRIDTYVVPAGGGQAVAGQISNISKSVGQMGVADLWPVGNYSSKIEPCRRSVNVFSPWHVENIAVNPGCVYGQGGWLLSDNVIWMVDGIEIGPYGHFAYAYQEFSLGSLKNPITISARVNPLLSASGYDPVLYMYVAYETNDTTYYGDADGWTTERPSVPRVPHELQTGEFDYSEKRFQEEIPSPNISEPGTLVVYIAGRRVNLKRSEFYLDPSTNGYRDIIHINNGARGEDDEVEIMHGRILQDEFNYHPLLIGAMKRTVSGVKGFVYKFADSRYSNTDFLALITLDYALSAALSRLRREGIIDTSETLNRMPVFMTIESVRHIVETYEWDLYNDEARFSCLSLPAASITVESESVTPLDSGSGSSAGGSSSGGSGGGSSTGVSLLNVWRSLTNNHQLNDYDSETLIDADHIPALPYLPISGGTITGSVGLTISNGPLSVAGIASFGAGIRLLNGMKKIWFGTGDNAPYLEIDQDGYFHASVGFYSDSFVTAGGIGSSGGGGGGGSVNVYESEDLSGTFQDNDTDVFNAYVTKSIYDSLQTANSNISSLQTAMQHLGDAASYGVATSVTQGNGNLVTSGAVYNALGNYLSLNGGQMNQGASIQFDDRCGFLDANEATIFAADGYDVFVGAFNASASITLQTTSTGHLYHRKNNTGYEIWDKYNLANPCILVDPGVQSHDNYRLALADGFTTWYNDQEENFYLPSASLLQDISPDAWEILADRYWVYNNYLAKTGGTISGNLSITGTLGVTGATSVGALSASDAVSIANTGSLSVAGDTTLASLTASGLATFNAGARVTAGQKLYIGSTAYMEWDSANSAIKVSGNIYATGFVTAGGIGSGSGGGSATAEWYNIKMKREKRLVGGVNKDEYEVTIENYTSELTDSSAYKMVFLRWRKGSGKSSSWHAPFLSPASLTNNIPSAVRSWAITARVQDLFNGTDWETVINTTTVQGDSLKFKASRNRKLRFGCAVYKYTGEGTYGWHRISNIAYVELFINNNGTIKKSIRLQ